MTELSHDSCLLEKLHFILWFGSFSKCLHCHRETSCVLLKRDNLTIWREINMLKLQRRPTNAQVCADVYVVMTSKLTYGQVFVHSQEILYKGTVKKNNVCCIWWKTRSKSHSCAVSFILRSLGEHHSVFQNLKKKWQKKKWREGVKRGSERERERERGGGRERVCVFVCTGLQKIT